MSKRRRGSSGGDPTSSARWRFGSESGSNPASFFITPFIFTSHIRNFTSQFEDHLLLLLLLLRVLKGPPTVPILLPS